ncbi:MAG: ThuA domain-containing protein [Zavarzinella sp.]
MWKVLAALFLSVGGACAEPVRKIVLIAGPKDAQHPVGTHEYEKTVRALKFCMENSPIASQVRVEAHINGWPSPESTLDDADTIILVSSGSDRDEQAHPLLVGKHLEIIEKQMKRGCGLGLIHWSTFLPKERAGRQALDWIGGYFDYESGQKPRGWYSQITTLTAEAHPTKHAVGNGVKPFSVKEEWYHHIRFREKDPQLQPLLVVPIAKEEEVVCWGKQRTDGGRGFGFTGGHFFSNWQQADFRKFILNSIFWSAGGTVPAEGITSVFPGEREIAMVPLGKRSEVLLITGDDHPAHNWREVSQMLKLTLERGVKANCTVANPEIFAEGNLDRFDLIVLNYCNWKQPGLSDKAKANLLAYLQQPKGLAIIHFANGAYHFSLPNGKTTDWPEYRNIVPRVWEHGKSGHDSFGKFVVNITKEKHPITEGLSDFSTTDELYYRQQGDQPITVLATARSNVSKRDEPIAWVSSYGKSRVFQTVLGHATESIRGDGPTQLISRGCAWAAGQTLKPLKEPAPPVKVKTELQFAEGKFGKALNPRSLPGQVEGDDRWRNPPLTVEAWAKLENSQQFNVVVSSDPKESVNHWEIYSYVNNGHFAAYLPGYDPPHVQSKVNICDKLWHHLAMTHRGTEVELFVDGKSVAKVAVKKRTDMKAIEGPLFFGGAKSSTHQVGCVGLVDDVRISNRVREVVLPKAALVRDEFTVSLWNLDGQEGLSADTNWTPPAPTTGKVEDWQKMTDKDWIDARFAKTDTGNAFQATFDYTSSRGKQRIFKGTSIRVGDKLSASVLFDRNQLRYGAMWLGDLNHSSRRFGLLNTPQPAGTIQLSTTSGPGWANPDGLWQTNAAPTGPLPKTWARFRGLTKILDRTVLHMQVGETSVLEVPWQDVIAQHVVFTRTLELGKSEKDLITLVAEEAKAPQKMTIGEKTVWAFQKDEKNFLFVAVHGAGELLADDKGKLFCKFAAKGATQHSTIAHWVGTKENAAAVSAEYAKVQPQPPSHWVNLSRTIAAEKSVRWRERPETELKLATSTSGPLVLDTFTLPYKNPYNALFFVTGIDFLPDGRPIICTAHGDVWIVNTLKVRPNVLQWQRFATGLYQSLGIRVRNGDIFVLERGQLTKLVDHNNDGEADWYENFNSDWHTGGGEHSYDTCLETDPEGNFFFFKTGDDHTPTGGCLLKVKYDGSEASIYSTGFRHPIGLGMSPDGVVSGADQEGNWMPATRLDLYRDGGFYGDMRTHHRAVPPTTYDLPYLWIPKEADNSAGGQFWLPKDQFGSLGGKMIHLSYGRCRAYAVLPDTNRSIRHPQAAIADLGLQFLAGSARGRVHPKENSAYIVGLNGWQTAAKADGSLQRIRYQPEGIYELPVRYSTSGNTIELSFDRAIDPASIKPESFTFERWNYRYSSAYGSKDWSVENPEKEARDTVGLAKVELLNDNKTVKITPTTWKPAMQVKLAYKLKFASSGECQGTVYTTIHAE